MNTTEIKVTITAVAHRKENGWSILKTDICDCFGVVPWEPEPGDQLILNGSFSDGKMGNQEFKFKQVQVHIETDPRALLDLACSLTKGFGPKKADMIWNSFGDLWESEEIFTLKGVNIEMASAWYITLSRMMIQRAQMESIAYLVAKGCSVTMATAAYKVWESSTVAVIDKDCFQLAGLKGYGFKAVDGDIRLNFGIEDDDPRRLDACILYCMDVLTDYGNTIVELYKLLDSTRELVPATETKVIDGIRRLQDNAKVVQMDPESIALNCDHSHEFEIYEYYKENYAV